MAQWVRAPFPIMAQFDSIPVRCHIWVEIVVGSHLATRVFSRYSEFPPSNKFQFAQVKGPPWKPTKVDVASSHNIVIERLLQTFTVNRVSKNTHPIMNASFLSTVASWGKSNSNWSKCRRVHWLADRSYKSTSINLSFKHWLNFTMSLLLMKQWHNVDFFWTLFSTDLARWH